MLSRRLNSRAPVVGLGDDLNVSAMLGKCAQSGADEFLVVDQRAKRRLSRSQADVSAQRRP